MALSIDSLLKKINALHERADHPNTPAPEADACRAKAEILMAKYRIEEEQLREAGQLTGSATTPGESSWFITFADSPFEQTYRYILAYVAAHTGIRVVVAADFRSGKYAYMAEAVGFEADLRLAEMLFNNAAVVFRERMEPKPNPYLSDEENVYRMRNAGMERPRIGELMGWGATAAQKVTTVYKRACRQKGEEPMLTGKGTSMKVYREQYANGFTQESWLRLEKARNAADQVTGGQLVLANRKDAVDEAFYEKHPHLRPKKDVAVRSTTQRRSRGLTKADLARYERMNSKAGQAGRMAGKSAAADVQVGGVKHPKRINE